MGSGNAAALHRLGVGEAVDKPIAVNVGRGVLESTTILLTPRPWSRERRAGWTAGQHEALAALFGASTPRES